ncbi:three-Cys-motif partner protein TcmP [Roseomonas gilardii]|uniref:three-Cys-motif partner protein TcmP n=1 Tax=Roseomonas gilardii TaxID=257708 RepID=UPI00143224AB|nr:three-Cys-motif partner protein TcmP [Roseomonas gilardii]
MREGQYRWGLAETLPEIGEHSKVKHDLYRQYLRRYLEELIKPRGFRQYGIEIFDTFSGGGVYRQRGTPDLYYGSPIIILEVLHEMQQRIQENQRNVFQLNWRLHLVDANRSAHDVLRRTLAERGYVQYLGSQIILHEGKFEGVLPNLIGRVHGRRKAIFLLDQFGYRDVPFKAISQIFESLHKPEVILTFAFDQLARWMQDYDRLDEQLRHLGVEGLTRETFDVAAQAENGIHGLIQRLLTQSFERTAKYYTPFFITSRKSHTAYWLVHLSTHARARDVMTTLHWAQSNQFSHYGGSGYNMLGFDPYSPPPNSQGFMFDEDARSRTEWLLQEDLPKLLDKYGAPISFRQFFAENANHSPADSTIIRQVFAQLAEHKQVHILTADGGEKRVLSSMKPDDVLILPEQPTFHFLRRPAPTHALAKNLTGKPKVSSVRRPSRARVNFGPLLIPSDKK